MAITEAEKAFLRSTLFENEVAHFGKEKDILNIAKKEEIFAKALVKSLYENIVYKEDFEIAEEDKSSSKFAETFVKDDVVSKIVRSTLQAFPSSASDAVLKESAQLSADALTKLWVEDGKFQLNEVEMYNARMKELNREASDAAISAKFSLYEEFHRIKNINSSNADGVTDFLICEMDDNERMILALRMNAFKGSLKSIGLDAKKDEKLSEAINEEFGKKLF